MATLDDLLNSALASGIMTPEQQQARVQRQVSNAMPENLRRYGALAQQQNEAAFGKGMGLSTWNAYQQALNSLAQMEGAGQIENQAQNSVDQAQRAAVGNAVSYATAEKNRAAQQQMAAAQRHQANSMQNKQMLYSGIGAGVGGLANIGTRTFEPEIRGGLRSLAGADKKPGGTNYPDNYGPPDSPTTEQVPNMDLGTGGGTSSEVPFTTGQDLSLGGDYSSGPAFGGDYNFGGFDLSNLFDSTYDPYYPGWDIGGDGGLY